MQQIQRWQSIIQSDEVMLVEANNMCIGSEEVKLANGDVYVKISAMAVIIDLLTDNNQQTHDPRTLESPFVGGEAIERSSESLF